MVAAESAAADSRFIQDDREVPNDLFLSIAPLTRSASVQCRSFWGWARHSPEPPARFLMFTGRRTRLRCYDQTKAVKRKLRQVRMNTAASGDEQTDRTCCTDGSLNVLQFAESGD